MLHHANKKVAALVTAGVMVTFAVFNGHRLTEGKPAKFGQPLAGPSTIGWPKPQPTTRIVTDAQGVWFEIGIRFPAVMPGNCANGWMLAGELLRLQSSTDLVNWSVGGFTNAAGSPVTNGDGSRTYWSRAAVPLIWNTVVVDLHATSNRQGKSITNIKIGGVTVSLPNYPYAMPASAATLQADLIAAGYAGSTVSSTAADLSVGIINHYYGDEFYQRETYIPTLDGANVTAVTNFNLASPTLVALPSYPYAMPAQQATLQADLRSAGLSGAVVMLYDDVWQIDIPDRTAATSVMRNLTLTITPDDPYPAWDKFGTYIGIQPANAVAGTYDNLRPSVGGGSLAEAPKQFFRY